MTTTRLARGLTLLEVVLAITLLAVLAVVALPVLVDATRASAPEVSAVKPALLRAWLTEQLAEKGAAERVRRAGSLSKEFSGGGTADRETATLRWIAGGTSPRAHGWVEAQVGDVRVLRFVAAEAEEKAAANRAGGPPP